MREDEEYLVMNILKGVDMSVDNDFLARADAEAKLRVIRKAREDMGEGVITSTKFFTILDETLSQERSYQVFRSYKKPQSMED